MKKVIIAAVAVIILLGIGGGAYYAMNKHQSSSTKMPAASNSTKSAAVFSSIQDALARSLSLSCDYTNANGVHTMAYIKNGEMRADITGKTLQETGSMIMKDKKIYFWNATMGMMMTVPEVSVTPNPAAKTTSQGENQLAEMEQYKQSCKVATVSDSLFDLPKNVKFTDESQLMKQMPSVAYPTGTSGNGGYAVPSQYQQYVPQK